MSAKYLKEVVRIGGTGIVAASVAAIPFLFSLIGEHADWSSNGTAGYPVSSLLDVAGLGVASVSVVLWSFAFKADRICHGVSLLRWVSLCGIIMSALRIWAASSSIGGEVFGLSAAGFAVSLGCALALYAESVKWLNDPVRLAYLANTHKSENTRLIAVMRLAALVKTKSGALQASATDELSGLAAQDSPIGALALSALNAMGLSGAMSGAMMTNAMFRACDACGSTGKVSRTVREESSGEEVFMGAWKQAIHHSTPIPIRLRSPVRGVKPPVGC